MRLCRSDKLLDAVPKRSVLLFMMLTLCCVNYLMRINISVSIIAMVPDALPAITTSKASSPNQSLVKSANLLVKRKPEDLVTFDWTAQEQSYVISAYSWGYAVTALLGGTLAERWGPRRLVLTSMLAGGVLSLLSPEAAKIHYIALVVVRTLTGLFLGVQFPAIQTLIARWAPPNEKGIFLGVGLIIGSGLGTVLMWNISGPLIGKFGWDYTFYVPGIIAIIWSFLWCFFVYDSPSLHPRISEQEKKYILTAIGDKVQHNKKIVPPFIRILTSIRFYALVMLQFGTAWGISFVLTVSPKYISSTLGFNLSSTGSIASLPYVARTTASFLFGVLGDMIRKRNLMSTTFTRKFFCIFSHVIPGLLLITLAYIGSAPRLSVAIITISVGFNGAATITNVANSQDLAPNFAGTLFGIANGISNIAGIAVPLVTGYFTKNGNSIEEWRPVLFIGATLYIVSALVFVVFGTGETQKWNYVETPNKDKGNEHDSEVQKV